MSSSGKERNCSERVVMMMLVRITQIFDREVSVWLVDDQRRNSICNVTGNYKKKMLPLSDMKEVLSGLWTK